MEALDWNPLVVIMLTVVGTGIALALAIVPGQRALKHQVGKLGERVAGIEGFLRGRDHASARHEAVKLKSGIDQILEKL